MSIPSSTPRLSPRATLACLGVLALHRALVHFRLGIAPDPEWLTGHWQHLDLALLRADLPGALMALHAQPPLWNGVLGLIAGPCGAEAGCVVAVLHGAYLLATVALFFILLRLGERLAGWPGLAAAIALGFCLSPAALYYENYPFYPHLTALLFAGFALALLRWVEARRLRDLATMAAALVALAWVWALFHPLFVAIVLVAAARAAPPPRPRATLAVLAAAVLLAMVPAAKNQMTVGVFSASTWLGLNLAQVAPADLPGCGFHDFLAGDDLQGLHPGTALNDPRIVALSRRCQSQALAAILARPDLYLAGRVVRLAGTLSRTPSDYFFDPLNWARYPRLLPEASARPDDGPLMRAARILSRGLVLGFNLAVLGFMLWRLRHAPEAAERRFLAVIVLFAALFLALGYGLNGAEQERMRYTLQPVLWLYGCLMGLALARRAWLRPS